MAPAAFAMFRLFYPADIRRYQSLEYPAQIIRILCLVVFEHHLPIVTSPQDLNLSVRVGQYIAEAFPVAVLQGFRLLYNVIARVQRYLELVLYAGHGPALEDVVRDNANLCKTADKLGERLGTVIDAF